MLNFHGSRLSIALLLAMCCFVNRCGFQLKGTDKTASDTSLSGKSFRLISAQPRNELTAALIQQLTLSGATISDDMDTPYLVSIGAEAFQQRNLSLTAQARSAEVELTMTTDIQLQQGGQFLIEPTTAMVIRQFLNDPRNVVGKTEELRLLREEMRTDLAAQIIRRISYTISANAD